MSHVAVERGDKPLRTAPLVSFHKMSLLDDIGRKEFPWKQNTKTNQNKTNTKRDVHLHSLCCTKTGWHLAKFRFAFYESQYLKAICCQVKTLCICHTGFYRTINRDSGNKSYANAIMKEKPCFIGPLIQAILKRSIVFCIHCQNQRDCRL